MKSNSTRRVLRGEGAGRFKGTTPGVGIVTAGDQSSFYLAHLAYELWIQIIATNVFIHNHSIIHSFLLSWMRRCFWSRVSSHIRYPKVNCPWAYCSWLRRFRTSSDCGFHLLRTCIRLYKPLICIAWNKHASIFMHGNAYARRSGQLLGPWGSRQATLHLPWIHARRLRPAARPCDWHWLTTTLWRYFVVIKISSYLAMCHLHLAKFGPVAGTLKDKIDEFGAFQEEGWMAYERLKT